MEKYYCSVIVSPMRAENSEKAEMVSQILYGETCEIIETENNFSKIKMDFDGTEGWIHFSHLKEVSGSSPMYLVEKPFGVYDLKEGRSLVSMGSEVDFPVEKMVTTENLRESIKNMAEEFINVPFLWGGRSFFGVDSSGFVQLVYKIHGINLPRNAPKQSEVGKVLDFLEESNAGDLAFFEDENGEINHVGIMLNNYEVIHSYGKVRIDSLDSSGIFNKEMTKHTHKLRFVKTLI